jgi:RNA recognition motif-containing protein
MNLDQGTNEDGLKALFAPFGEIESVFIQQNEDGSLKNQGFVCFKEFEHAKSALEKMNKHKLESGNVMIVSRHVSKKENALGDNKKGMGMISQIKRETFNSNIYVKFLPASLTQEELHKTFSQAGTIISINLKQMKSGDYVTGQFAYILYDKVEEAQNAIRKFDNTNIFSSRPMRVELWLSKEEIEQQKKQREGRQINQIYNYI